eukprot:TRINITY_DN1939_c0_g1_i1.p2 TRINITY_DN1939_c0_g1~~TRINITY_DN1939_c0_g1_i1.p2  ORF type:complete len:255 (-),score=10.82 TRINITY_DN1939_c0_g1_i1:927-1691(-)
MEESSVVFQIQIDPIINFLNSIVQGIVILDAQSCTNEDLFPRLKYLIMEADDAAATQVAFDKIVSALLEWQGQKRFPALIPLARKPLDPDESRVEEDYDWIATETQDMVMNTTDLSLLDRILQVSPEDWLVLKPCVSRRSDCATLRKKRKAFMRSNKTAQTSKQSALADGGGKLTKRAVSSRLKNQGVAYLKRIEHNLFTCLEEIVSYRVVPPDDPNSYLDRVRRLFNEYVQLVPLTRDGVDESLVQICFQCIF